MGACHFPSIVHGFMMFPAYSYGRYKHYQGHMLIPMMEHVQRVSVCKPFALGMQSLDAVLLSGQASF